MLHEIKLAVVGALVASALIDDARAETRHAVPETSTVLIQSIYDRMDMIQTRAARFILASAESGIALRLAAVDRLPNHRPMVGSFVIAHLEP
jgi:hypothetical protein